MQVVKANGNKVPFDQTKIQAHAAWASKDLNVSQSELESNIGLMFYDGISTNEISKGLILAAAQLISEKSPDYDYVAARLLLQNIYKEVTGGSIEYPKLIDYVIKGVEFGQLSPLALDTRFDFEALDAVICPERDLNFKYLGVQTLQDRYLLREPAKVGEKGKVYELPQHFFMRVAMGLALNEQNATQKAIEFYSLMSQFDYMPSTPTLFNAMTLWPQLSSCYGNFTPDDLEKIFDLGIKEPAMLSKFAGGIGSSWTQVRGSGSPIKTTNGLSSGPVPYLKIYNDTAVAVNQGGKRKGAFAPYLEPWHVDFMDFIDLKVKTGDEHLRTHDIFPAVWTPDLFFKRKDAGEMWSFFCPSDVPNLHETFGEEFERLYEQAEKDGLARKQIPAMEVWQKWLDRLNRTGSPWVTFKDACNERNPQAHCGVIHNSNLCTEITLNNSEEETFVCNLGSINLGRHVEDGEIDSAKLANTVRTAVRMLDNVVDINYYPTENAKRSNLRHRPIGLGVMGYADFLLQMGVDWESEEHIDLADRLFEMISFHAINASCDLAIEREPYSTFEGSTWSQGKLTVDTAKDQTCKVFPAGDWNLLRQKVKQNGIRNSNITSIAPTATIANIVGTTEGIQSLVERVTIRETISGNFKLINPLHHHGRPDLVKTMWEIDPVWVIKAAAARQKWIDQSQSLNLFKTPDKLGRDLDRWYSLALELGVKTTYYLKILKKSASETVDEEATAAPQPTSSDDFECEACQ